MKIASENDITELIHSDKWMMDVLRAAAQIDLPDWWIGAGFLRNKVWDSLSEKPFQPTRDIDLVYFNREDLEPETDWSYDEAMKEKFPFAKWEVRNQARMHYINGFEPYSSTEDGISHWTETATCVGVRLKNDKLEYLFCYGVDDLFGLAARPTPYFQTPALISVFRKRIDEKGWRQRWPHLKVFEN